MSDPTPSPAPAARAGTAAPDEAAAFAEAMRLYAGGDPHGALALVRPLVEAHPESLSARLLVARCAARLGAPAVALATAEEASACDPTSWEAQVLVAQAAIPIDLEKAQAAADRAMALAPEQAGAVEARTAVRVALQSAAEDTPSRRSGGGFGRRPAKVAAPEPAPEAPVLPPSFAPDEPKPERPIRLPKALQGTAPEGTEGPPPAPVAPYTVAAPGVDAVTAAERREAGLDELEEPAPVTKSGPKPLLVLGSVTWLFLGFRYGVQVIGGPIGIALFVGIAVMVAAFWRTRAATSSTS